MLTVFGSTALDTIRTPTKILKNVLGGAATFAGISASFFVNTGLIAVVGNDFPKKYYNLLSNYLDLRGLTTKNGKTFHYDGSYDRTLSIRKTLKTDLNVLKTFKPIVPEEYKKSNLLYFVIRLLPELLQYTRQQSYLLNYQDTYQDSSNQQILSEEKKLNLNDLEFFPKPLVSNLQTIF